MLVCLKTETEPAFVTPNFFQMLDVGQVNCSHGMFCTLDSLILEDSNNGLSRNISKKLPLFPA
jgi:hypothetical protein